MTDPIAARMMNPRAAFGTRLNLEGTRPKPQSSFVPVGFRLIDDHRLAPLPTTRVQLSCANSSDDLDALAPATHGGGCLGRGYGHAMEESVKWLTLQQLRDELDRTRPAWDELADLDDVLQDGQLPALGEDARRHQLVQNELLRRPNNG
jgi:hypothetical protein